MRRTRNHIESGVSIAHEMMDPLGQIIGTSPAIQQVKSLVKQVATSEITVLISGESGTGKELVANALHYHSKRRGGPMLSPNCGAIPEGIFESEIFGHEKGSFTSADHRRQGYFEMAHKGTLFLDEIGEMPLQVQVKILRVLETGRFLRVGGSSEVDVDVRVIAATNKDLGREVMQGRFRQDLYYRLNAVNISLPPLRDRVEDIPLLATHFVGEYARRYNRPEPLIDPEAHRILQSRYWAGNIRELRNFMESLVALGKAEHIDAEDVRVRLGDISSNPNLPVIIGRQADELNQELVYRTLLELKHDMNNIKGLLKQLMVEPAQPVDYRFTSAEEVEAYSLDELEKEQILKVLNQFKGNRRRAAEALGIGERTLYRKIKQYHLK